MGSMLRARPLEEKALTARAMERSVLPLFASGSLRGPDRRDLSARGGRRGVRALRRRGQARQDRADGVAAAPAVVVDPARLPALLDHVELRVGREQHLGEHVVEGEDRRGRRSRPPG